MIVGDANEGGEPEKNQVSVAYFFDPSGACFFGEATTCPSDDEAADFDFDYLSEMQLTRLPLTHREKIARTVENFLNKATSSAIQDRVLLTVGDYAWQSSTPEGLHELMDELIGEFQEGGYLTRYMRETDYGRYDYLPKALDTADSLNEGVDIMVNTGTVSNRSRIAGDFIQKAVDPKWNMDWLDDSGPRPFVFFGPTCDVADFDRNAFGYDPTLAEMFLCNDPQKPAVVAWIGHGRGNWGSWYRIFAAEFVDWLFSGETTDILDCYWKTKQSCWVKYPEMHNFLRSTFHLGWPVGIRGNSMIGSSDMLVPDGGEVWTQGHTNTIQWDVSFQEGAYRRLRKHSIYLTRNGGGTWSTIQDSVVGSAQSYNWTVSGSASYHCKIKVVTQIEAFDTVGGTWEPAYTFECMSAGEFRIREPSHPCPHLYAWKDGEFRLVNSVLQRRDVSRNPIEDRIAVPGCGVDQSNHIRFMIDQTEPDTTYFYGAGLVPLPLDRDLIVTIDGSVFELGAGLPPTGVTDGEGGVLWEMDAPDDEPFLGDKGTVVDVVFPSVSCTHALLGVGGVMRKPPVDIIDDPFGEGGQSAGGIELDLEGRGMFVAGEDTAPIIRISPRQFLSSVVVEVVEIEDSDEPLVLHMTWHSEHPVDFVSMYPEPTEFVPKSDPVEPSDLVYVPGGVSGGHAGSGDVHRLAPGDRLYLDFKLAEVQDLTNLPCLLMLNGFYVGPAASVGRAEPLGFSLRLTTGLPCAGPLLAGKFSVPEETALKLDVYDVRGRLVNALVRDLVEPGVHDFEWNLRNASGHRVASGLYFLRLGTPDRTVTKKVVIKR